MIRTYSQVFITLLSFSECTATKWLTLDNEACLIRPTLIDLNPIEINYYPSMIGLYKCNGCCNLVDNLSTKICFPSETKDLNVKVFNIITSRNEAKTLIKHISCDCKCKFNNTTCNRNQKWINNKCQYGCKRYCTCTKDDSWNPSACICEDSKYLKSIVNNSVIVCDEVTSITNILIYDALCKTFA